MRFLTDLRENIEIILWKISNNVTNTEGMFGGCTSLTSLDLRNFNTSNVTNMIGMFGSCRGLTSLDLSGWNMSKIIYASSYMFSSCRKLTSIRMVGCSEATINKIQN